MGQCRSDIGMIIPLHRVDFAVPLNLGRAPKDVIRAIMAASASAHDGKRAGSIGHRSATRKENGRAK
jgi:hypothetical protein